MPPEEMIDNDQSMYASIVNIYGRTQDVITMLTNVVPNSFIETKQMPMGVSNEFHMVMTPRTPKSSEIRVTIKPESCFYLLRSDNVYSPDTEVVINTDKSVGNGIINGIILCYQGLASLDLVKENMASTYRVIVEDTIGMIVPINRLDQLKESYAKHKTMVKIKV